MLRFLKYLASWVLPDSKFSPPALDSMKLRPDGSDANPLMVQFFTWDSLRKGEQSWWQHLESEIPELARLGVTQVWIPPPTKAAAKDGRGYDAYDLWDLGEFDQKGQVGTRWGTKEELLQTCITAKNHSVDMIVDAVLNILTSTKWELIARRSFPPYLFKKPTDYERQEKSGISRAGLPLISPEEATRIVSSVGPKSISQLGVDFDRHTHKREIYRIVGGKHSGWSPHVDCELGNYDYLLGSDVSGFRLDAIKHIDWTFLLDFLLATKGATNSRLFVVSEYWSPNLRRVLEYVRRLEGQSAFFDVPLHAKFHEASKLGSRYDLRGIMNNTLAKARPRDAVTFVDNHEWVFCFSRAMQRAETDSVLSTVEDNFKVHAYALILLRPEGYPCVFYGDLYPNEECYNESISQGIRLLIEVRKKFAYGTIKEYPAHRNCIGFIRTGDAIHSGGCAVVLSNKEGASCEIRMNVGRENGNRIFKSFLGQLESQVKLDNDGWGSFLCVPGSAQVWVPL
ncbi:hypothetical protein PM082_016046 [Marasmius tenuissimus]|nr:hypothetical protein PM082_016046 [Marasmius tenuissimus]